MSELEKIPTSEKWKSLTETFDWFAKNEYFINDVWDILKAFEKWQDNLQDLKSEYESKLQISKYKNHYRSLIFIIDYINQEKGNVYVIKTIRDFAETSLSLKK